MAPRRRSLRTQKKILTPLPFKWYPVWQEYFLSTVVPTLKWSSNRGSHYNSPEEKSWLPQVYRFTYEKSTKEHPSFKKSLFAIKDLNVITSEDYRSRNVLPITKKKAFCLVELKDWRVVASLGLFHVRVICQERSIGRAMSWGVIERIPLKGCMRDTEHPIKLKDHRVEWG